MSAKSPRSQSPKLSVRKSVTMGALGAAGMLAATTAPAQAQTVIQLPDSLYTAGDTITWVKRIPTFCEGPAWDPATGYVYFTRQQLGATTWPIIRVKPGVDTGVVFVASPGEANGLDFDPQGRLVAAQRGRLTRYNNDGSVDSVLFTSPNNGVTVGLVNDLSIGSNGAIYMTTNASQIYYLSPDRKVTLAYNGAASANGIDWVEEDSVVYVNEQRQVKRYKVNPDGTLSNPVTAVTVLSGSGGTYADGGAIDAHGNFYVAGFQDGILRVFNAQGDSIGRIVPRLSNDGFSGGMGNVSNVTFGGPDMKTLFFTGDGGLYSIPVKIPGRVRPGFPGGITGIHALPPKMRAMVRSLQGTDARDLRGRMVPSGARTSNPALRLPATPNRE